MDAGIAAEAAIGRHQMGAVAGQEDPPLLQPLGDVGGAAPARAAFDLDLQLAIAGGGPHQLDQPRLGDVGRGIGPGHRIGDGVADGVHHQKAPAGALLQAEEAAQGGV